jgi:hypothetical protein
MGQLKVTTTSNYGHKCNKLDNKGYWKNLAEG